MTQHVYTDEQVAVTIRYRNHRGEVALRRIMPAGVSYRATEWHSEPQWLLEARDLDKGEWRSFAMRDILEWGVAAAPTGGAADVPYRSVNEG